METKNCPYCSEIILETAKKCKFCGEFIDEDLRKERKREENTKQPVQEIIIQKKNSGLVTFILILVAIILVVAVLGV